MVRSNGKSIIPVELLRRSARRKFLNFKFEPGSSLDPSNTNKSASKMKVQSGNPVVSFNKGDTDELDKSENTPSNKSSATVLGNPIKLELVDSICFQKGESEDLSLSKEKPSQSSQATIFCHIKPDAYIPIDSKELDLERTLLGGQSFRWFKDLIDSSAAMPNDCSQTVCDGANKKLDVFTGTIEDNVIQLWRCNDKKIAFKKLNREGLDSSAKVVLRLHDYFQTSFKLEEDYKFWAQRDSNFAKCSKSYQGFRILRQDPVENLFSFICATNNNIKRISLMINAMCRRFGTRLEMIDKFEAVNQDEDNFQKYQDRFFTFPTVERLAQDDVFQALRYELGFGYRAKFICETAKRLISLSTSPNLPLDETSARNYLLNLRLLPYKDTCKRLQEFPGIGRKVADCICLMSMDHLESVPIDCHIYEIVCRDYLKNLHEQKKTLTESVHDLIGKYFVDLHGSRAGWATSVLFIGELKHLKQQQNESKQKIKKMKQNKKDS